MKKKVLFVCSGNRVRSVIAKLHLSSLTDRYEVNSVGVNNIGDFPIPYMIRAAEEYGYDISTHQTRVITPDDIHTHDVVFCMDMFIKTILEKDFENQKYKLFYFSDIASTIRDIQSDSPSYEGYVKCISEITSILNENHQNIEEFIEIVEELQLV